MFRDFSAKPYPMFRDFFFFFCEKVTHWSGTPPYTLLSEYPPPPPPPGPFSNIKTLYSHAALYSTQANVIMSLDVAFVRP